MPPRLAPPPGEIRVHNRILSALSQDDYRRVAPHLVPVKSKLRKALYHPGEPVDDVYFPNSGVYCIVSELSDGTVIESATIGYEGVLGVEALLRPRARAFGHTMLQVPVGTANRLNAAVFRRIAAESQTFANLLGCFLETVVAQMMQALACRVRHTSEERCCRWLLMVHDRMESDEFSLTQEFLAMMIGARRQTVTTIASTLQRDGLIQYKHGRLSGIDRAGLERRACECYGAQRRQLEALFTDCPPPDTVSC